MFALKKLPPEAIPAALDRAEQYRREEQPEEAESICHDVLRVDPDNQRALAILLLALADRAGQGTPSLGLQPREILPKFRDPYDRAYYGGVVAERRALAMLHSRGPDGDAYDDLRARRWTITRSPPRCVPTTPTPACAGTPAPA